MRLFDTASGRRWSVPAGPQMSMYVCGITPYAAAHLGHAFTFLTYDLIRRRLQDMGKQVRVVRNISDVDEPMYPAARRAGVDYLELAERESTAFWQVMHELAMIPPEIEPRPSVHIEPIALAVEELLSAGFAYRVSDDVYFDVAQCEDFGAVSGYDLPLMRQLSQVRGGDPARRGKRSALDFLLWRAVPRPADVPAWASGLGRGRPGWHIECSVMARAYLGESVDVHGGGSDLIYPHHDCEHVQNEALGGPRVRSWVHTAPLGCGGEKMSKSLGNLIFVRDLLAQGVPAMAVRLALLGYHYRRGGEWCTDVLTDAERLWEDLVEAVTRPAGPDPRLLLAEVRAALDDDLDTPRALRAVRDQARSLLIGGSDPTAAAGLVEALNLLGIDTGKPDTGNPDIGRADIGRAEPS